MDPANLFLFLLPEVIVCSVGLFLIVVFGKEALENRRLMHIGKNGTPVTPMNYWGRYNVSDDKIDQTVHVAEIDRRS